MIQDHYNLTWNNQRGAALLILTMIMILTVAILMVAKNSSNKDRLQEDADVTMRLAKAREGIISIAVSHTTAPGRLPYPVRVTGGGFDGSGDCIPGGNPTANQLIGRFPFLSQQGCDVGTYGLDVGEKVDPLQNPYALHYVVSRNLVFNTAINPATLLASPDWITVFDSVGQTIANRVAFVILHPGPARTGQNRAIATANAAQFLDTITIPGEGLINHANMNTNPNPYAPRFVVAESTNTFNDKLVYATADEILRKVESRLLNQIRTSLNNGAPGYPAPGTPNTLSNIPNFNLGALANWNGSWTYSSRIDCREGADISGCNTPGGIEYPPGSNNFHDAVVFSNLTELGSGGINQFIALP